MEQNTESQDGGVKGILRRLIAKALQWRLVRTFLRYSEHQGPRLADSVTYRALFSVFAAVLLGFSLAALWLGNNPDAMRALTETLESVIPGITDVVDPSKIDAPTGFTLVGIASLAGLVGAAIGAITSLRSALRRLADQVHEDGFFLWVLARNLLVAIAFGGLLGIAAAFTVVSSMGVEMLASWLGFSRSGFVDVATRAIGILVVFIIDTLAIALVFRLLSGVKPPAKALWIGSMLGGVGLVVLQELSSLFVRGASSNPLLASFATLVALLLWFNFSAQVILIASTYIVVAAAEAEDRVRERFGARTLAQYRRRRAEDRLQVAAREVRTEQEATKKELREQRLNE
ncbi:MAG: YihY/virulence factor BrkB family protein [Leucobacter sp.]